VNIPPPQSSLGIDWGDQMKKYVMSVVLLSVLARPLWAGNATYFLNSSGEAGTCAAADDKACMAAACTQAEKTAMNSATKQCDQFSGKISGYVDDGSYVDSAGYLVDSSPTGVIATCKIALTARCDVAWSNRPQIQSKSAD